MKGLCVYVDGGKGHYIPAKAVQEKLIALGHDVELVEFFDLFNLRLVGKINKNVWRLMLKMPKYEESFSKHNDQESHGMAVASFYCKLFKRGRMKKIIERRKPEFFFTTHPYPDRFISELLARLNIDIPVFYFASDVFSAPMAAVNPYLKRFYISTAEGVEKVSRLGQSDESLRLAPFPLQASCADSPVLSKKEARKRLGLKEDVFTLQLNLGGEGIGTTGLLKELGKSDVPMQITILGGMHDSMKAKLESIIKDFPPHVEVKIAGFITNVNEYLYACDIIAGRAGINTIVEAIHAHRPFLITELVYTVLASADYIEKYNIGWNAALDFVLQANIVMKYARNPALLDEMDKNFGKVPIEYSAERLAEMVVEDVRI